MPDSTLRGRFELAADQPIRALGTIRDRGGEADAALKGLGSTMDKLGGARADQRLETYRGKLAAVGTTAEQTAVKVGASWEAQRNVIDREATRIEGRVDVLQQRVERFGRVRASATVGLSGFDRVNVQLSELEARLDRLDRRRATASVGIGGGFGGAGGVANNFAGGAGGGGGAASRTPSTLFQTVGGAPTLALGAAALSPGILGLAGGAVSLAGSASSAALGAGAVGLGAYGIAGAGGLAAYGAFRPAISGLTGLTKAQTAYNAALQTYGARSSQARTAQLRLTAAQAQSTPQEVAAARQVAQLQTRYQAVTAPARAQADRGIAGVAYNATRALPAVGRAESTATGAVSNAAINYSGFLTSGRSLAAGTTLVGAFARELPTAERTLQNITGTLEHLAVAAIPFFHEANAWVANWTAGLSRSSSDQIRVQATMGTMVNSAKDWARLMTSGYHVVRDLFSAGRPQGDSMVMQLTNTLNSWDAWIEKNPQKVNSFFDRAEQTTSKIASALVSIAKVIGQVATALTPIFNRGMDVINLLGGLGSGGLGLGGALLYGGYEGARGALGGGGPSAGALASSYVLGSAGPRTMRAAGGGAPVSVPGESTGAASGRVSYLAPRTATSVPVASGTAAMDARSQLLAAGTFGARRTVNIGAEAPLLAAIGGAGYVGSTAARGALAGPEAFAARYGGIEGARFAGPVSTIEARAGLLSRAGGVAGGALAGAAKFALPLLGINAALTALGTHGGPGTKALAGLGSAATLGGLLPLPQKAAGAAVPGGALGLLGARAAGLGLLPSLALGGVGAFAGVTAQALINAPNAGGSLGDARLQASLRAIQTQAGNVRTPEQLHAVQSQIAGAHAGRELDPQEANKLQAFLVRASNTAAANAGIAASNTWQTAFETALNRGESPQKAVRTMTAGMTTQLRELGPKGSRQFAASTAQWVSQLEQSDPKLRKPLQKLMNRIVADVNRMNNTTGTSFKDLRDKIFEFNGQILTGSQQTWGKISDALTNPAQVAQEKLLGIFGQIQTEATNALTQMGFTKGQARALVTSAQPGRGGPAGAASAIVNPGAPSPRKRARGGMIPGAGLLDTVATPDGGLAAPGETWIANRHTMRKLDYAALGKFGKTAWQMIRDEDRPHSAPMHATGGIMRRYMVGGAFGGGNSGGTQGGVYPFPPGTTIGRTDQGIDANMPVGAPIGPMYDAQIKGVIPNWYKGQPYLWWQLLNGPRAGQYAYVAEQITGLAPVGARVGANQAVARYAGSGTGIEYGWATAGGQTLAKATSGYSEGQVTPAGSSIRAFVGGLAHGKIVGGQLGGLGAPVRSVNLRAPRSGLRGVPGALADQGGVILARGLQQRINAKLAGGASGGTLGPAGGGRTVGASEFGGPGDPGTGSTGYRGDNLYTHPDSFAELGMGTALGNLPYMAGLRVTGPRGSKVLYKRDIGLGGGPVNGVPRDIDLWFEAAQDLGVSGLGLVKVEKMARGGRANWGGWNRKGGSWLTHGPTVFGAGENGTERVSVSPVRSSSTRGRAIHLEMHHFNIGSGSRADAEEFAKMAAAKILTALEDAGDGPSGAELAGDMS